MICCRCWGSVLLLLPLFLLLLLLLLLTMVQGFRVHGAVSLSRLHLPHRPHIGRRHERALVCLADAVRASEVCEIYYTSNITEGARTNQIDVFTGK